MRVTVCQISNEPGPLEAQWSTLCEHVASSASDLVVLPEMPFSSWLPATRDVDRNLWRASVTVHRRWCERLHELGAAAVVG